MDTPKLESPVTVGIKCPICGAEEPEPWFEQPMNETIRAYARSYVLRPVDYFFTMEDALAHWGQDFNKEDYPEC